ncbi:MAG: DUF2142 domain-containing protein [Desulfovibrio sp.]|nr:DUF2142 domain-containing protein [Desulfovibrio sp.]MBI4958086.1 DUF2142 domain-containing protein [Desulfovibrio sp.]
MANAPGGLQTDSGHPGPGTGSTAARSESLPGGQVLPPSGSQARLASTHVWTVLWFLLTSATLALVVAMAFSSAFNAHPDEKDHVGAGQYYMEYWDPPKIGDERALGAYSNYGVSYLNQLDAVYFVAGKFACLVKPFVGKDYLALRLFNVGLLVLVTVLAWKLPGRYRIGFLPLYISPQAWYVFSYFNGDALPLALTFISAFLLVRNAEDVDPSQARQSGTKHRRLLLLGATLGILAISKQNYYVFLAFLVCSWVVVAWFDREKCLLGLKQAGLVLGLAAVIFCARYGAHVWIVRHQPVDAAAKVAEQIAPAEFKPSALEKGEGFWGSRMRSKGVTLVEMFTGEWKWHIFTFRSAFGKYGTMDIEAPLIFYRYIGWALDAFAVVLFAALLRAGPQARVMACLLLVFTCLTVFQSLWHSWTSDFQAQGRYLFPILGMAACVLVRFASFLGRLGSALWVVGLCMWGMSAWSFVTVGLARIPK